MSSFASASRRSLANFGPTCLSGVRLADHVPPSFPLAGAEPLLFRVLPAVMFPYAALSPRPPATTITPPTELQAIKTVAALLNAPPSLPVFVRQLLLPSPSSSANIDVAAQIATSLGVLRTLRVQLRRVLEDCMAMRVVQRDTAASPTHAGTPGDLGFPLLERALCAWGRDGAGVRDAHKVGVFLVRAVRAWTAWTAPAGKERVSEEVAALLKDVLQEMDERVEDGGGPRANSTITTRRPPSASYFSIRNDYVKTLKKRRWQAHVPIIKSHPPCSKSSPPHPRLSFQPHANNGPSTRPSRSPSWPLLHSEAHAARLLAQLSQPRACALRPRAAPEVVGPCLRVRFEILQLLIRLRADWDDRALLARVPVEHEQQICMLSRLLGRLPGVPSTAQSDEAKRSQRSAHARGRLSSATAGGHRAGGRAELPPHHSRAEVPRELPFSLSQHFIGLQLLLANEGWDDIDEPTEVCFDFLAGYTYVTADPKPAPSPRVHEHRDEEQLMREGVPDGGPWAGKLNGRVQEWLDIRKNGCDPCRKRLPFTPDSKVKYVCARDAAVEAAAQLNKDIGTFLCMRFFLLSRLILLTSNHLQVLAGVCSSIVVD
ncbi:hypothetical protein DFH11DRAFT_1768736 [Phellopilus nigrolimitatus]|nr:hypothetical protein DFH11DRAFT_1768736 [Phellopilus nigrolimitatus]